LECTYIFVDRFMQKRDESLPLRKDVTNFLKATEDAVFHKLGVDDKLVFSNKLIKIHTPDESSSRFSLTITAYQHPITYDVNSIWRPWPEL